MNKTEELWVEKGYKVYDIRMFVRAQPEVVSEMTFELHGAVPLSSLLVTEVAADDKLLS